ncbi:MAG: glycosyltransferase family 4 protein [Ilumatobacteraceae bacterium]
MLSRGTLKLMMGFYFFPRGGSAQVARYLCRALDGTRWKPSVFSGSMGTVADNSNARRFFNGVACESLDYSAALSQWRNGGDAMATGVPMPASFEDKAGVPDRIILDLDDDAYDRQVTSWTRFFAGHAGRPDVVHLHHLTPMHEAVHRIWPGVPVVTHLHGTELKMLSEVHDGTIPPSPGRFSSVWVARMQRWASDSDRVVVVAQHDEQLVRRLLPVDPWRVSSIGGGVDTDVFSPRLRSAAERMGLWRRWLVDEPRGWCPGEPEGSIRYIADDLSAFTDADGHPVPVVLFAGRFMRFKRLQLLIEAHHLMRSTTECRSVLVVAGGFPCEWEGEHPYETVRRLGAEGVFFAGWRDHHDLSDILSCSDVFAAPSVDEPFGLVYLEAMASGVPPIGTTTGGPLSFINVDPQHPTGWMVPPDNVRATAGALAEAVSNPALRSERGRRCAQFVRENYSWAASAKAFTRLYDELVDAPTGSKPSSSTTGVVDLMPTIGVA